MYKVKVNDMPLLVAGELMIEHKPNDLSNVLDYGFKKLLHETVAGVDNMFTANNLNEVLEVDGQPFHYDRLIDKLKAIKPEDDYKGANFGYRYMAEYLTALIEQYDPDKELPTIIKEDLTLEDRLVKNHMGNYLLFVDGVLYENRLHLIDNSSYANAIVKSFINVGSEVVLELINEAFSDDDTRKREIAFRVAKRVFRNEVGYYPKIYYVALFCGLIAGQLNTSLFDSLNETLAKGGAYDKWSECRIGVRVASVANQMFDGTVICGVRHYCPIMRKSVDAFLKAKTLRVKGSSYYIGQGFTDQWGNFLNRKSAFYVALFQDQILKRCGGDESTLYSENLH